MPICQGTTLKNEPCTNLALKKNPRYCHFHVGQDSIPNVEDAAAQSDEVISTEETSTEPMETTHIAYQDRERGLTIEATAEDAVVVQSVTKDAADTTDDNLADEFETLTLKIKVRKKKSGEGSSTSN